MKAPKASAQAVKSSPKRRETRSRGKSVKKEVADGRKSPVKATPVVAKQPSPKRGRKSAKKDVSPKKASVQKQKISVVDAVMVEDEPRGRPEKKTPAKLNAGKKSPVKPAAKSEEKTSKKTQAKSQVKVTKSPEKRATRGRPAKVQPAPQQ